MMTGICGVLLNKERLTPWIVSGILAGCFVFMTETGWAQGPKFLDSADMKTGIVEANKRVTMKINGAEFKVSQEILVTDGHGNRGNVHDIVPGFFIKFHMIKGVIDRIECSCVSTRLKEHGPR
jgi:hypothetical protein